MTVKRKDTVTETAEPRVPTWFTPQPFPSYAYTGLSENYVYCDAHCEVHGAKADWYGEHHESCKPENWRPLYVATDDPEEEF